MFEDSFTNQISLLSKKNTLIALHLYDDLEKNLPNIGLIDIEDIETGQQMLIDTSSKTVRKQFNQKAEEKAKKNILQLKKAKILSLSLDIAEDYYKNLLVFFKQIKKYFP